MTEPTNPDTVETTEGTDGKDPSNTPVEELTAPLDPDDDVHTAVTLVNTEGNEGDVPSF